jgi:hypothetical protein
VSATSPRPRASPSFADRDAGRSAFGQQRRCRPAQQPRLLRCRLPRHSASGRYHRHRYRQHTDLDPEFTVAIASGTGTIALDNSQAPTRIGDHRLRPSATGTPAASPTGKLTLTLKAGSFNYLNAAKRRRRMPRAICPSSRSSRPKRTWIDVRFTTVGGVALDADLLKDDRREFSLSGSGIGSAALLRLAAPIIASSADDIDNNGDGVVDEADETVVRYYVSRSFRRPVRSRSSSPAPTGPTPTAIRADGEEGFQVISTLKTRDRRADSRSARSSSSRSRVASSSRAWASPTNRSSTSAAA